MTPVENQTKTLIQVSPEMAQACQSAQLIQSIGECNEYGAEVVRHFQGRDPDLVSVTNEAADVVILMMQIRELVGADKFDEALAKKFQKFVGKINEAKLGK